VAELGETEDPKALIPGNAVAVGAAARSLRARGNELALAGQGLKRIDTTDGWSGEAADAFRAKFQGQPGKWLEAGDCFRGAAGVLESYVYTLTWTQGEAGAAIKDWNAAQAATEHAQDAYEKYQQAGGTSPFADPGEPARAAAQQRLGHARAQLKSAAGDAAQQVKGFRDKAPEKPGVWSKIGDFFSDVGAGVANTGGHVVNGLASLGSAAANHPGDLLTAAAGAGLMIAGAAGDAGGLVLDATGVGALVGVPANVVSTAAIVTGGAMVAGATGDLVMHATGDDQTSPVRTDHTGNTAARDVHGVDRTGMRDVDEQHVWDNGDMYVQDDGCIVKILDNGNGTYDVVVRDMSNPSGKPVTSIKDATEKYVNNKVNSGKWE
jgi:type VII secretion system ESX-1 substrate